MRPEATLAEGARIIRLHFSLRHSLAPPRKSTIVPSAHRVGDPGHLLVLTPPSLVELSREGIGGGDPPKETLSAGTGATACRPALTA